MLKNKNLPIWIAIALMVILTSSASWIASSVITSQASDKEIASLESKVSSVEERIDTTRSNRDIYRENSAECALAYNDLRNIITSSSKGISKDSTDKEVLTWAKSLVPTIKSNLDRVNEYDERCQVVTDISGIYDSDDSEDK